MEILQPENKAADRREAVWIRLGLWDGIRAMGEKAAELERLLPEETRQAVGLEHDSFTQRILRPGEYVKIENELKKAESLRKQVQKLKKENETLNARLRDLSSNRSAHTGRADGSIPGLLRRLVRRIRS